MKADSQTTTPGEPLPLRRVARKHSRLPGHRCPCRRHSRRARFLKTHAERVLGVIFEHADFIGRDATEGRAHLLLSLPWQAFRDLCTVGAEIEDMEDNGDAEPDDDGAGHTPYPVPASGWIGDGAVSLDPVTGKPGRWAMLPGAVRL